MLNTDDVLYHYCSLNTFISILSNRYIRLSCLDQSNDYLEGKYGIDALVSEARKRAGISGSEIADTLYRFANSIALFGFCLSEEPDILSQWRAYADDGRGIAIGFRKHSLIQSLHNNLKGRQIGAFKVTYEKNELNDHVRNYVNKLIDIISKKRDITGNNKPEEITKAIGSDFIKLYSFKNSAFKEEKEFRLISLIKTPEIELGRSADLVYTERNGIITSYIRLGIDPQGREYEKICANLGFEENPIIKDIYIGPRNQSSISMIKGAMAHLGYHNVNVHYSRASYR